MNFCRSRGIVTIFLLAISTEVLEVDCQIPDDIVIVDDHPVLQRGLQGKLNCEFNGTPQSVTWRKGNTFSYSSTLVLWHDNVIDGESYRTDSVTLDANYSLVINRVNEDDAGRYYCNVIDYRGILIGNYTDVSVRDFLSVKGCSNTNCSLIYDRQDSGLLCQARNVPQDLVNIYWLHDESEVSDIAYHFSKYNNGTQNIDAKIPISTGVQGVFTCVAESQSTQDELQRIAVTITMTPTSPTITDSITSSKSKGRLVALIVSIIAGVLLGVTCLAKWLVGKGKREPEINQSRYSGSITYLELWEMCSKINNYQGLAKALTQFLMGDDCQLVVPPKDMYNGLCRWKEKTEEEMQLSQFSPNKILQKAMEEYRSKQGEISHDDISHICWSVDKQPQRLEKLLNELGITQIDLELEAKRAKVEKCSALLAEWISAETQRTSSNVNEGEDIELKEMRVTEDEKKEKRPVIGGQNEERTPVIVGKKSELTLMEEDKKEEQRTGKENKEQQQTTVKEKYINFMVTLCLALENTGCKEVAKTFFQISEKNKKPLDKESIETVALAITKRHFVSLSRETHMKPEDVDARNRENLEWMFRTDKLLEDWVSRQKCSNYEIRCRLREAVEKCDRKDVADTCIEKDQCAIYDEKEPSVAIQNEQARPTGKECRAYKSSTGNGVGSINDLSNDAKNSVEDAPSEKTALLSQTKDQNTEETEEKSCSNESEEGKYDNKDNAEDPSECQTTEQNDTESGLPTLEEQGDVEAASTASTEGEEDVGKVSSITKEEIQLIRKYADPEVVRSIAIDLRLDNPESVDDMDIVLALERERGRRRAGRRERIRKALKKTNAKYEEILAEKRNNVAFRAENPRLARRLLMTDVYPFAKAFGYNSHRLSQFQVNHCLAGSEKGTNEVVRQQHDLENKKFDGGKNHHRTALPKLLRKCGYLEIARTFYFDFEVSTSDLMAVATRIEPATLAEMLCIEHYTETQTRTEDKIQDNMKMLTVWRKMMCPPDYNHRTALADIMHDAGFKHVAIGILIGDYRDCVPSREVLIELARQIPASAADQLCKVLGVKAEQPGAHNGNDIVELLVRWVEHGKEFSRNVREVMLGKSKEETLKEIQAKISDKVYDAGFFDLANEIMTGIKHGKVTELTKS